MDFSLSLSLSIPNNCLLLNNESFASEDFFFQEFAVVPFLSQMYTFVLIIDNDDCLRVSFEEEEEKNVQSSEESSFSQKFT
jgi:hypothetical protein